MLDIPDHLTGWLPIAVSRGYSLIRREGVDAIFSSAPYWTNHLVGLALKRLTGLPWTAHFRDPWTTFKAHSHANRVSSGSLVIERWLERRVLRDADWIVCVTDQHTEAIRRGHADVPPDKVVTIPNGYSSDEFHGLPGAISDSVSAGPRPFTITYTGSLYIGRDVTPVMLALRRLIDEAELTAQEVSLNLVGACETANGRPVRQIAQDLGLEQVVRLHGALSRAEALRFMVSSDLLLLLAEELTVQVPGKAYEYLRAGRPILTLTPEGATADLIRKTRGGDVVRPGDIAGIAEVVRRRVRLKRAGHLSVGADPRVVRDYDRRSLTGRFATLLNSPPPGGRR
jgi:glycosyltransferase involved in cell wall biosynthesis